MLKGNYENQGNNDQEDYTSIGELTECILTRTEIKDWSKWRYYPLNNLAEKKYLFVYERGKCFFQLPLTMYMNNLNFQRAINMKIVHINYSLTAGGAETLLVDIVNEQSKTQDVSMVIINQYYDKELFKGIDEKVKLFFLNRKPGSNNFFKLLKLWRILINFKPDVIHCHNHTLVRIMVFRKKCVLTVHDVNIPVNNFKHYKKVFAISDSVKTDIEKRSKIKPVLVYNGIKIDEVKCKEDYTLDTFKILQVSRLDHEKKGQHLLLNALKILVHEKNIQ
ncbi:MAG: glycosyltransferase, partial [Candidatus Thorarchaeota archaeon]